MKPRATLLLAAVAIGWLGGDSSAAPRPGPVVSAEAFRAEGAVDPAQAVTLFNTGFEPAESFAPGPLEGQAGWACSSPYAWCLVSSDHPCGGVQHVRLIKDPTRPAGSLRIGASPTLGAMPPYNSRFTGMVCLSGYGGSSYDVFGQAPSQGLLSWRVEFAWSDDSGAGPGTIYVLDDPGSGLQLVNTGVAWTPGAWKALKVEFDYGGGRIRYYYDGAPIYAGTVYAGRSVEQVGFLHDNYQNDGESGNFDDFLLEALDGPAVPAASTTWSRIKALDF